MQHEKSNSAQSREALNHTVNSIREKQQQEQEEYLQLLLQSQQNNENVNMNLLEQHNFEASQMELIPRN